MPAEISNFSIYPNPATQSVTVKYEQEGTIELIDVLGRTMLKATLEKDRQTKTLDLHGLIPGVYGYRYMANGRQAQAGKLVIE